MTARIARVADVRRHGDSLTIVTVQDGDQTHEVVANLQEDGSPRWAKDETVVYVSEGSIVPEDVLRDRGYWDEGRGKGLLEGKRGDRVKMRRFAGFESRGLLFRTRPGSFMGETFDFVDRAGHPSRGSRLGDDVSEHLGIVEHGG
jgi:hypothetical protein